MNGSHLVGWGVKPTSDGKDFVTRCTSSEMTLNDSCAFRSCMGTQAAIAERSIRARKTHRVDGLSVLGLVSRTGQRCLVVGQRASIIENHVDDSGNAQSATEGTLALRAS